MIPRNTTLDCLLVHEVALKKTGGNRGTKKKYVRPIGTLKTCEARTREFGGLT